MSLEGFLKMMVDLRNLSFERGFRNTVSLDRPVISVGNLTVGGTGKTPFLIHLATQLLEKKKTVGVVSRNYRAGAKDKCRVNIELPGAAAFYGDEPAMIATQCSSAAVFVGPSKAKTAAWARRQYPELQVFLIDDGFQHRTLGRNFDIVLIDATDAQGLSRLWPWGRARESLAGLSRANWIVLTKVNWASDQELKTLKALLPTQIPMSEFEYHVSWPSLSENAEIFAFAGLGRSEVFLAQAREHYQSRVVHTRAFQDHQKYGDREVKDFTDFLKKDSRRLLLTTEKDAIKLRDTDFADRVTVAHLEVRPRCENGFYEKLWSVV